MKKKNYSSLVQYYLAFISVALIGCAITGMIIFFVSVSELRSTAEQTERNRLTIAANDLDTQIKVFENIRDDITGTLYYRPGYLFQTRYHEIELLEDFKQYSSYSVLCKEYFLYYLGTDYVFFQDAKCPFSLYFNTLMTPAQPHVQRTQLQHDLNQVDTVSVLSVDENRMVLAFPLQLSSAGKFPAAVLCFVMPRSIWLDRIHSVTGGLTNDYAIFFNGNLLAGSPSLDMSGLEWQGDTGSSRDKLACASPSGKFVIVEQIPHGGWYSRLRNFSMMSLIVCAASIAIVLILSFLAARRSQAPIRRLAARVQDLLSNDDAPSSKNELKQIEHALMQISQQNKLSQKHMDEQMNQLKQQTMLLKQQVLLLVLNGNTGDGVRKQMENLGIILSGPYFCVYILNFPAAVEYDVLSSIELLSDEDQTLYAMRISSSQAAVIGSFTVECTAEDAKELLQETAAAMDQAFTVQKGKVIDSLDKMLVSYYTAQIVPQKSDSHALHDPAFRKDWYPDQFLCLLLEDIRRGDQENALKHVDCLIQVIQKKCPSMLIQRSVVADILSELVRLSYELQIPISSEEAGALLVYQNVNSMQKELRVLVADLFKRLEKRNCQIANDLTLRIQQYIDQHALEYDISLQKVAEHFGLSAKQVNSYLQSSVHQTYKEYELNIRIRKSKELLTRTSLSIAEISEQIGYGDVSSFIKAFKNAVGITPTAFRKILPPDQKGK